MSFCLITINCIIDREIESSNKDLSFYLTEDHVIKY